MIWDVLFEILKHFNLFKLIMKSAYLKLSDETSNKIFYLKFLKLETSQTCHGSYLFEAFRWDLTKKCYLKIFKLETFQSHHGELLIWNFQMRLETRYSIWNVWNLKLLKHVMGVAYLKLSDETWNEMCYMKFWNLKLLKHVMGVAYLKLSDETWKRGAIWNFSNLKLFKPIMGSCLFETFRWDLKWDVLYETFETWNFSNPS